MRCQYVRCLVCFALLLCCVFGLAVGAAPALAASSVSDPAVGVSDSSTIPTETDSVSASDPVFVPDSGTALSDVAGEFSDLAYMDVSCNLGDLRLYLPHGVELAVMQVRDGLLYNVSNTTVYLYCPDYPGYTFSASRFSPVMYRADGYNSYTLSEVVIFDSVGTPDFYYLPFMIFCIVFICLYSLWRGKS